MRLLYFQLSVKSPQTPAGAVEQEYGEKAEDAVDYEDIDEQYEGPKIQAASEEDYLLPKKDFFSTGVSLTTLKPTTSLFDNEDYDEDEEFEKENEVVNKENEFVKEHEVWIKKLKFQHYLYQV
ncbi:hypothetical protein QYF36_012975 [Acer negundo]|nr:hypothetical protein QYF36_012975 [Acer negundo]